VADPICTLVHVSDLHFGASFVIDGGAAWRRLVARTVLLRQVTGYFPHGYQAAGALAVAVRQIIRDRNGRGIPTVVVHSGDLTASGIQSEFSVGTTFLRHGHYLENGSVAGLRLETEFGQLPFDIPGNHDLWSRRSPKDHEAFTSHYGGVYPRTREVKTKAGRVLLWGLDSNRSSLWQHRLANGEITDAQLNSVCESIKLHKSSGAIQVVCTHHPLATRRRSAPRMLGWEILKLRQREAVAKRLGEAGAQLTLSGHVHAQHHIRRRGTAPLHFVAGSACQISSRPSFWLLDLHADRVAYTYYHMPKMAIQFEVAWSRSGSVAY
jgi:3',5'-cyclic AMP phosphodiesterase CpdA